MRKRNVESVLVVSLTGSGEVVREFFELNVVQVRLLYGEHVGMAARFGTTSLGEHQITVHVTREVTV